MSPVAPPAEADPRAGVARRRDQEQALASAPAAVTMQQLVPIIGFFEASNLGVDGDYLTQVGRLDRPHAQFGAARSLSLAAAHANSVACPAAVGHREKLIWINKRIEVLEYHII